MKKNVIFKHLYFHSSFYSISFFMTDRYYLPSWTSHFSFLVLFIFSPKLYFRIYYFLPFYFFSIYLFHLFSMDLSYIFPFSFHHYLPFSQFTISPRNFVFFYLSIFCFYNSTPKFIHSYPFPSTSLSFSFIFLFTIFFRFIPFYLIFHPILFSLHLRVFPFIYNSLIYFLYVIFLLLTFVL